MAQTVKICGHCKFINARVLLTKVHCFNQIPPTKVTIVHQSQHGHLSSASRTKIIFIKNSAIFWIYRVCRLTRHANHIKPKKHHSFLFASNTDNNSRTRHCCARPQYTYEKCENSWLPVNQRQLCTICSPFNECGVSVLLTGGRHLLGR